MSGLDDILSQALGGGALSKIAGQLGLPEDSAKQAIGAALPALIGRMKQNADDPAGAQSLANAVAKDHDGSLLDNLDDFLGGGHSSGPGAKILGKVFGGEQDSTINSLAGHSGLDAGKMAGLLGMLAPLLMGALGKSGAAQGGVQASGLSSLLGGLLGQGGGLGGMLGGLLGGGGGAGGMLGGLLGGGGGAGGALGGLLGGAADAMSGAGSNAANAASNAAGAASGAASKAAGGLGGMLDRNKDGSIIDDVARMAGGAAGGKGAGKGGLLGKVLGMLKKR